MDDMYSFDFFGSYFYEGLFESVLYCEFMNVWRTKGFCDKNESMQLQKCGFGYEDKVE